ncbi:MAG: cytochrome c peroxidase [Bacteroidota bacterium]
MTDLRAAYARPAAEWPTPELAPGVEHQELAILNRDGLRYASGEWDDLKAEDEKALRDLGKRLFFDPRLSASNQISCASCHDPDLAWGDGRRRSFGHDRQRGKRNAPTLLNAGHWESLFWDGRAASLEEQVLGPLQDSEEMHQSLEELGPELSSTKGYPELFRAAFGVSDIDVRKIAFSIAAFERSIHSRTSRFDHFLNGKYESLSDQEIRGLHLFRTKGRCLNCHNGPLFSDQQFHNMGSHLMGRPEEDLGLYKITKNWDDAGKFRTPSLRDIVYTGPYLHHGNIMELREVLQMYSAGMPQVIPKNVRKKAAHVPVHDPILQRLDLTKAEIDDLLAFLQSISTRPRAMRVPELVK